MSMLQTSNPPLKRTGLLLRPVARGKERQCLKAQQFSAGTASPHPSALLHRLLC